MLGVACILLMAALVCVGVLYIRLRRGMRAMGTKLAEEASLKEAAERANRAKSDFLTHVSHEIRTPMNGIMGFTELALRSDLSSELREYLDTVRTSAEWLMQIVTEILDFARIEAGRLELDNTEFVFAECIGSAIKFVQQAADLKRLRMAFKIDPLIPARVSGDPTRLRQVLVNLLDNAVKFTTTGSVMLSATLESNDAKGVSVRLSIADTGMGISAEKQALIFEPFRLADGSLNKNYGGAGLGLAISSRLVALMGGTMDVLSQIGAGATFRFAVRLQNAQNSGAIEKPQPPAKAIPSKATRRGHALSILVAEDNPVNLRLVTRLLESVGHSITSAANGREAVHLFSREAFDLILMDVEMPEMDGFQATAAIRSTETPGTRVPIYALTAHAQPGDREKCLSAGMDGYLSKPIQVDDLVKIVGSIASRQKKYSESPASSERGKALELAEK